MIEVECALECQCKIFVRLQNLHELGLYCICCRFPVPVAECTFFKFLDIIRSIVDNAKWASHLRNSCRRLRIVSVIPGIDSGWKDEQVFIFLELNVI